MTNQKVTRVYGLRTGDVITQGRLNDGIVSWIADHEDLPGYSKIHYYFRDEIGINTYVMGSNDCITYIPKEHSRYYSDE